MAHQHGETREHHQRASSPVAMRRRELSGDLSSDGAQCAGHASSATSHGAPARGVLGAAGDEAGAAAWAGGRDQASAQARSAKPSFAEHNFPQHCEFGFAQEPARAMVSSRGFAGSGVRHNDFPQLGEFGFEADSGSDGPVSPSVVGGGRTAGYCAAHYPARV